MGGGELEQAVAELSRRQHGAFSRTQVLARGGSDMTILRRCRSGEWLRLAPGVYASADVRPTWERQVMAACLVHDPTPAAAAGTTAAVLHGADGFRRGRPKLIVPHRARSANPLAVVQRSRHLFKSDIVRVGGIPTLAFERLVLDLATTLGKVQLGRFVEYGVLSGRLDPDRLIEQAGRVLRGPPSNTGSLAAVLEERWTGAAPAASALETAAVDLLDGAGYKGRYTTQAVPPWFEPAQGGIVMDFLFDPDHLILECDGRLWHARLEQWERDHRRDAIALAHGYVTVRVTWRMLHNTPRTVTDALKPWIRRVA